jgi:predicted transcriptional regulator
MNGSTINNSRTAYEVSRCGMLGVLLQLVGREPYTVYCFQDFGYQRASLSGSHIINACSAKRAEEAQTYMPDTLDFGPFRPDRPGIRKVLGDLEAEIMELIWARPGNQGTTVRDIFEILYERRRLAYTTIMSTMTRLAKKGLLRARKSDQAYIYYPTLTQDEFISRFVGRILEDLFVNFSGATLERLRTLPDPQAAQRAEKLLEEIERRRAAEDAEDKE